VAPKERFLPLSPTSGKAEIEAIRLVFICAAYTGPLPVTQNMRSIGSDEYIANDAEESGRNLILGH
jgi:hypothetical protein